MFNWLIVSGLVPTTREEFEKERSTLKTNPTFSVHTVSEEFKNTTIFSPTGFVFAELTRSGKWTNYSCHAIVSVKLRFLNMDSSTQKRNVSNLKWILFEKNLFSKYCPSTRKLVS